MSRMRLDSDWGGSTTTAKTQAPKQQAPKQQAPKQQTANFGNFRASSSRSSAPAKQSRNSQSPGGYNRGAQQFQAAKAAPPKPKGPSLFEQLRAGVAKHFTAQWLMDDLGIKPKMPDPYTDDIKPAMGPRGGQRGTPKTGPVRGYNQQREEKVEAERANLYGVRNSGRENPQGVAGGKETVLGVDEYNSLGGRHKAAVDFNGMLRAAYNSDDKLSGLDKDKSGHVTMSELNDDVDVRGYRAAYKRMFGVDPDANTTYSPATLGLLNSMDLRDTGGRIENFTKGRGYIDADEIGRGAADGAVQGPSLSPKWMAQQGRDDMVTKLTDGMSNLQKTLESGRVQVGATGAKVRLGGVMPDEDRDNAVQVFRQGLLREDAQNSLKMLGENPRFNPSDGLDLSSLVDPNEREQRLLMDDVARFALQSGVTAADLKDPAKLRAMQFGSGQTAGIDVDRFAEHIAEMEQGSVSKGTTLEDDIMAQLGQLGG